jgi:uncharacterized protein (TIGR00725 family)
VAPPTADTADAARPYIAVVGAAAATAQERRHARAVGRELARAGAVLICGGMSGVMEAACRGMREGGGLAVGLLPGSDRREANRYVDVAIATGLGELRNGLIVRAADALVAVGGEWGTLSEVALALKAGKPVIGLGTWDLVRGAVGVHAASEPAAAVLQAIERAGVPRG